MGVGFIGWTRKFDWASVTHIRKEIVPNTDGHGHGNLHSPQWQIAIVGDKQTKVNFGMNEDRRLYVLNALRALMKARSNGHSL